MNVDEKGAPQPSVRALTQTSAEFLENIVMRRRAKLAILFLCDLTRNFLGHLQEVFTNINLLQKESRCARCMSLKNMAIHARRSS